MTHAQKTLQHRAEHVMPAGVNSPVRAFRSVGGSPLFAAEARGARITTTDGRELIDLCMSFGPLILGHAHPAVVNAVQQAASRGTSYAVTTEAEIELAELIQTAVPSMELMRLVSSGTEACMTAIRLARGATGRSKILKFSGCYHGHADCLLVQAGSGVAGIASASSAGVPCACANQMLVAPYNDLQALDALLDEHGEDLSAIIVEPLAANMGLVHPHDGYLEHLRTACDRLGALLIFDEVITGFRFTFGGYQALCGIQPDLTCLGKAIGGGMPIGAVGGRKEIVEYIAPLGPVYQGGTLSGNPVSVAAGLATLRTLQETNPYPMLARHTETIKDALKRGAEAAGISLSIPVLGSLFSLHFQKTMPENFDEVSTSDTEAFNRFFHACLERGVYLAPSSFEAAFLSTAHDEKVVERLIEVFQEAIQAV